jgi:hypothetical protein
MFGPVSTTIFLDSGGHVGFLVIFYLEVVHTLEVLQPSPAHANPKHNSTTVPSYRLQPAILGTEVCSNLCCDHRAIGDRTSLFDYGIGPVICKHSVGNIVPACHAMTADFSAWCCGSRSGSCSGQVQNFFARLDRDRKYSLWILDPIQPFRHKNQSFNAFFYFKLINFVVDVVDNIFP